MKSKKLLKKGGNPIQNIFKEDTIPIPTDTKDLYDKILKVLNTKIRETPETDEELANNNKEITKFLSELNELTVGKRNIFVDIANIVTQYVINNKEDRNFQSVIENNQSLFPLYKLFIKEDPQHFITIDPTIIQIMIFDPNITNTTDIVYSLKLILRGNTQLTIRYTTQLFPRKTQITNFKSIEYFNQYNFNLNREYFEKYEEKLQEFIKIYIKYYNFYKKCYEIECNGIKTINDYQLRYISILGKARFWHPEVQQRTAIITDYIMSNLLFACPSYAFISGGYKGYKSKQFGVTRSGYEIAKKYNRPVLTIMCKEGIEDSHQFSDAELIYGEHWGEDSIALSQLTDGAIIIAPFGGWTYIECLTLLNNKKIVGIYNSIANILNYNGSNIEHLLFFNFSPAEQKSILDYYINYYLIILYLLNERVDVEELKKCLTLGIQILAHFKTKLAIKHASVKFGNCGNLLTTNLVASSSGPKLPINNFIIAIANAFRTLKGTIDTNIKKLLPEINILYNNLINKTTTQEYQDNIPENCDGIWIKPSFDIISKCVTKDTPPSEAISSIHSSKGGKCSIENETLYQEIIKYNVDISILTNGTYNNFLYNLNTNIIFVFSDVMYLNRYLDANLNTHWFRETLYDKIAKLSNYKSKGASSSTLDLLKNEINDERAIVELNKSLDGSFDIATLAIDEKYVIKEKYKFIINYECTNYSKLLRPKVPPMLADAFPKNKKFVSTE
jgi:hypothetical protein